MESKTNPPTHYSLIWDEEQIRHYEEQVFHYGDASVKKFILCMGVRSKYCSSVKMKKCFFKRQLFCNTNSQSLVDALRSYEIPIGAYKDDNQQPIPTTALVLYASVNPRDTRKAAKATASYVLEELYNNNRSTFSLDSKFKTEAQKAALCKPFLTVDLDCKDLLSSVKTELDLLNFPPHKFVVETRGGYHIHYETSKLDKKRMNFLFQNLNKRENIDVLVDTFCPIPGTIQGGFKVRFVTL